MCLHGLCNFYLHLPLSGFKSCDDQIDLRGFEGTEQKFINVYAI